MHGAQDAFVLTGSVPDDVRRSRSWTFLRDTYLLLQLLTFSTAMTTVRMPIARALRMRYTCTVRVALRMHRTCTVRVAQRMRCTCTGRGTVYTRHMTAGNTAYAPQIFIATHAIVSLQMSAGESRCPPCLRKPSRPNIMCVCMLLALHAHVHMHAHVHVHVLCMCHMLPCAWQAHASAC